MRRENKTFTKYIVNVLFSRLRRVSLEVSLLNRGVDIATHSQYRIKMLFEN